MSRCEDSRPPHSPIHMNWFRAPTRVDPQITPVCAGTLDGSPVRGKAEVILDTREVRLGLALLGSPGHTAISRRVQSALE